MDDNTRAPGRGLTLEVLVAAVQENEITLAEQMNLRTDAVICNQCQEDSAQEFKRLGRKIRVYCSKERGVGRNRNSALLRAKADLVLFGDEDIIYDDDYEEKVLQAFAAHPDADILMFNVMAVESRRTYENHRIQRVRWYNYGRYPTYAMCCRLESLQRANVWFSLLYGGGARYSNGEDSLFLHDCLKKGLKIYSVTEVIGHERARDDGGSTWFHGFNEKFFHDRGVLYHDLYGIMETPFALRWLIKNRRTMCAEVGVAQAYLWMRAGMRDARI